MIDKNKIINIYMINIYTIVWSIHIVIIITVLTQIYWNLLPKVFQYLKLIPDKHSLTTGL